MSFCAALKMRSSGKFAPSRNENALAARISAYGRAALTRRKRFLSAFICAICGSLRQVRVPNNRGERRNDLARFFRQRCEPRRFDRSRRIEQAKPVERLAGFAERDAAAGDEVRFVVNRFGFFEDGSDREAEAEQFAEHRLGRFAGGRGAVKANHAARKIEGTSVYVFHRVTYISYRAPPNQSAPPR